MLTPTYKPLPEPPRFEPLKQRLIDAVLLDKATVRAVREFRDSTFQFDNQTIRYKLTKAAPDFLTDYECAVTIASFIMDVLYPATSQVLTLDYVRSDDHGYMCIVRDYPECAGVGETMNAAKIDAFKSMAAYETSLFLVV